MAMRFEDNLFIRSVVIPDTVLKIETEDNPSNQNLIKSPFSGCKRLIEATVPVEVLKLIDGLGKIHILFPDSELQKLTFTGKEGIPDHCCLVKENLNTIVIKEGVTGIGNGAFSGCSKLVSIKLPSTIHFVATHAFSLCSSLREIRFNSELTTVGEAVFTGVNADIYFKNKKPGVFGNKTPAGWYHDWQPSKGFYGKVHWGAK